MTNRGKTFPGRKELQNKKIVKKSGFFTRTLVSRRFYLQIMQFLAEKSNIKEALLSFFLIGCF